ncbi:hypothetical protein MMC14_009696 [Varicellaria rhodocarpa]|nr:hypothetical protein [Varicellaria rhodocarpa]
MAVLNEILGYQAFLVLSASSLLLVSRKAAPLWLLQQLTLQDLQITIKALHDQYKSNVVWISPDDLSFIDPSAWNDMLMFQRGRESFQKDVIIYGNPPQVVHAVLTANDADHARMRRILAHAFSEKAVKTQEPLVQSHIDILMG